MLHPSLLHSSFSYKLMYDLSLNGRRRIISLQKLCPIASQEAISTVSESTVGKVIHLRIFADDSPINQALKRGD